MSRYKYLLLVLLATSIITNVVLLMYLARRRKARTSEQLPTGETLVGQAHKANGAPRAYGGGPAFREYQGMEDLHSSTQQRIERLYAAKGRRFTLLDATIPRFFVDGLTVPQAVAKLCNDHTVLCGIEIVPWPSTAQDPVLRNLKRFSVSFEKASPRQILDSLVSEDPTFVWVEDEGVANVVLRKAYDNSTYPLNKTISRFVVADRPYSMVFAGPDYPALFSLPEVQEALPTGGSARWPRELEPRVSVRAVDKTVRQITNEVAVQVGMSWSLVSCPEQNGAGSASFQMLPQISLPDCSAAEPNMNAPSKQGTATN